MRPEIERAEKVLLEQLRSRPDPVPVHPLPDEIYRLTGSALIHWNRVEFELDAIVATLLMPLSILVTSALMHGHSVAGKADAFRAIALSRYDLSEVHKDAESLCKSAKGLSGDRNRVAHGRWQHFEGGEPSSTANLYAEEGRLNEEELRAIELKTRVLAEQLGRLRAYISFKTTVARAGI